MENKELAKLKNHRFVINLISFLFIMLLTIVLTTTLTLAAFGDSTGFNGGMRLGTIAIDDITQNFTIKDSLGNLLNRVAPGADVKVHFSVENTGTADILLRFRVVLADKDTVTPLDTSIFDISIESVTNQSYGTAPQYVLYNFNTNQIIESGIANSQAGVYFVRRAGLIGNLDQQTNDKPDQFIVNIHFSGDEMTNDYKQANIGLYVYVETVQYANNGAQRDVTLPGYDVQWSN